MKQKFTQNQLVKYIYRETTAAQTLAIDEALTQDWQLREAYKEMHQAYCQLPKATFSPSANTISNILSYSQQSPVEVRR